MHRAIDHNIDDLATLQFTIEWYQTCHQMAALIHVGDDTRTSTMITDIRMDTISHIQRSRAAWQIFDLTFRRKNKNLLLEEIILNGLVKLIGTLLRQFALPLAQLLNPGDHFTIGE